MQVQTKTIRPPTFDLSYVEKQLADDPDNTGLSRARIKECMAKYRNYLALCQAYPQVPIMPSEDIDLVWHKHILNTKRYHEDCQAYFGYYLHHNPKMPTAEVGHYSVDLYEKHFGPGTHGARSGALVMCGCSDSPPAMALVMCGCSDGPTVVSMAKLQEQSASQFGL